MKIYCPKCNSEYDVDSDLAGKMADCGSCGERFLITETVHLKPTFEVECPKCHRHFDAEKRLLGEFGRCGYCKKKFLIRPNVLTEDEKNILKRKLYLPIGKYVIIFLLLFLVFCIVDSLKIEKDMKIYIFLSALCFTLLFYRKI